MRFFFIFFFVLFQFIYPKQALPSKDIDIVFGEKKYKFPSQFKKIDFKYFETEVQAYGNRKIYVLGVKLCEIYKHVKDSNGNVIAKVKANDKFFAYLSSEELKSCNGDAVPYLIKKPQQENWPKQKGNHTEIGDYSLAWIGNKKDAVSKEKWVRNILSIELLRENKDKIRIPLGASQNEKAGYKVFLDYCSGCHSLNLVGQKEIGPDLNYPLNPTEYYSELIFRQFIRNPQSVRYFKNAKMEGFNEKELTNRQMNNLILFLNLIKNSKVKQIQEKYAN